MSTSTYRYPFSPFPDGWYCLGFSVELGPGAILSRTFMGREVVLFRTQSGEFCAADAHCPHLGGHLGYGGSVEGEVIRCAFHGFCYNTKGTCTKTGYGTKPPPNAKLRVWPSVEMHGLLLVFYDAEGRPPTWHVPDVDTDGWSSLLFEQFRVKSHPQETTENSVDFGHFAIVHGYSDTEQLGDLVVEGPYLSGKYSMGRAADVFFQSNHIIKAEFEVHVWGLGYSLVDVWVDEYKLRTRVFVLASPVDGDDIVIRSAVSVDQTVKPRDIHWGLGLLPRSWAYNLVRKMTLKGYTDDLKQDFDVWTHKSYVHPPVLAKGDGPVAAYRKYCRQFYPETRSSALAGQESENSGQENQGGNGAGRDANQEREPQAAGTSVGTQK